jgi:hypothetical protein
LVPAWSGLGQAGTFFAMLAGTLLLVSLRRTPIMASMSPQVL